MKKSVFMIVFLIVLLTLSGFVQAKKPEIPPEPNPTPGQDPTAAVFNLSFPMVATDIIDMLYQKDPVYDDTGTIIDWVLRLDDDGQPIPITVVENIATQYTGAYLGNGTYVYEYYVQDEDGCAVDADGDGFSDTIVYGLMIDWLKDMAPWFAQPATTTSTDPNEIWNYEFTDNHNAWQAEWIRTDQPVSIAFIDWGNPLENNNPVVGQRFPVEIAIYQRLATPMIGYKTACLEYPSTRSEVFGVSELGGSGFTREVCFATVLTNRYFVEVWNPDGTRARIRLDPAIGPSGKMNFASAGGGWIPTMPGTHRIWLHVNDPLISFSGAIINDDDHYIMSSGCMAATLNQHKLAKSGIVGNSTFIDVLVVKPSGSKK